MVRNWPKTGRAGPEVRAFLRYNSKNSWGWLEESEYAKEMEIVSGGHPDFDLVRQVVNGCDRVFHLAALIGIPHSYVSLPRPT